MCELEAHKLFSPQHLLPRNVGYLTIKPDLSRISRDPILSLYIHIFSPPAPWSYPDMLWTLAFSLIVIISVVGNSLVLWIVAGKLSPGDQVFVIAIFSPPPHVERDQLLPLKPDLGGHPHGHP